MLNPGSKSPRILPFSATMHSPVTRKHTPSKSLVGLSGSKHPYLSSLQNFDNIKRNVKFHDFTYKEITQASPASNKVLLIKKPKNIKIRTPSTPRKEDYVSLDPRILRENLPKKQEKLSFTAGKRKLLIDQYLKDEETMRLQISPRKLETIWHQTLTTRCNNEDKEFQDSGRPKSSRQYHKERRDAPKSRSLAISTKIDDTTTQNAQSSNKDLMRTEESCPWEESERKVSDGEENTHTLAIKELKSLGGLLKDFCKIVLNTQKGYHKAETRQKELYNFVSVFVEEIDELEKSTKEPRIGRLQLCVKSIDQKIEELSQEEDLLLEQIEHIRALSLSLSTPDQSPPSRKISKDKRISLSPAFQGGIIESPILSERRRFASGSQETLSCYLFNEDDRRYSSIPEVVNQLQVKTLDLKSDVQRLKSESSKFLDMIQKSKKASIRIRQLSASRKSGILDDDNQSHPESCRSTQKDYPTTQSQTVLRLSVFPKYGQSPSHIEEKGFDSKERQNTSLDSKEVSNIQQTQNEEPPSKEEPWGYTIVLYEHFTKVLEHIGTKIKEQVDLIRVFEKEVDKEQQEQTDVKAIVDQIEVCFETALNEVQEAIRSLAPKRGKYLDEVLANFVALDTLNKSNTLKLKSLKNIMEASIKKIMQIDKYRKQGKYDLTDKVLRQKHEQRYNKLKNELLDYRKTLEFLAGQLNLALSVYGIEPLSSVLGSGVVALKENYEGIWKTLYYLDELPRIEEEYNIQAVKAYKTCKASKRMIDSLKEFFKNHEVDIVPQLIQGEEEKEILKTISIKTVKLKKEFESLASVPMLKNCSKKPLLITIKLEKRLNANETELDQLLKQIQEEITVDYDKLIKQCEEVEKKVQSHLKRLMSNKEHLIFSEWRQNYQFMETLGFEAANLEIKLDKFEKTKYPPRVILLPKPDQKKQGLGSLKKEIEFVKRALKTGRILGSEDFFSHFEGLRTYNLKEKLEFLHERVLQELNEQKEVSEKAKDTSIMSEKILEDTIGFLMNLIFILEKSFELDDNVSQEYAELEGENLEDVCIFVQAAELEKQRDRYPRLLSAISFETDEKGQIITGGIDHNPPTEPNEDVDSDLKKKVLKKTMSTKSQNETYLGRMNSFIVKLKNIFNCFNEETVGAYAGKHILYKEISDRFKKMCAEEINMLERVQFVVHNVMLNHLFYKKEIQPMTKLHRCLELLQHWREKMHSLSKAKDWMINTLIVMRSLQGEQNPRGGIKNQLAKYLKMQEIITCSLDILISILSLGGALSIKDLKLMLGIHSRIDENSMGHFLKGVQDEFSNIKKRYQMNINTIEEDAKQLMQRLTDFIQTLTGLLGFTRDRYKEMFRVTSEGVKPNEGGYIRYISLTYQIMKGLTDTFCETLNQMTVMTVKPTWIVDILDEFYRDIILKDFHVCEILWKNSEDVENYVKEFKEEFIEREIKQKALYRKISDSNPSKCDRRVAKVSKLEQTLSHLAHSGEVFCRPELRKVLASKVKALHAINTVYVNFAMIYSMGRNLNDKVTPILANRDIIGLAHLLLDLEPTIHDMVKHLVNANEECKPILRSGALEISFNLEKVLCDEILGFYSDLKKWFSQVRMNLLDMVKFFADLKKNFRGEVLLLRNDWISFVKGWVSNFVIDIGKNLKPINPNYQDFKEKLEKFASEMQAKVSAIQAGYKETAEMVQYLNDKFLPEWFFNSFEEGKELDDKLSRGIAKLMGNIKSDKNDAKDLKRDLKDIAQIAFECDKSVQYLSNKRAITALFVNGVRLWNVVQDYYKSKNMGNWYGLLVFVERELVFDSNSMDSKYKFKNKVQTPEGLYLYAEQELKCALNVKQKEFLSAVYEWLEKKAQI